MQTLFPAISQKRRPPINLSAQDAHYFHLEKTPHYREISFWKLKNVVLTSEAVILKNAKVLPYSLVQYAASGKNTKYGLRYVLRTYLKNKAMQLPKGKKYLMLFNEWTAGYCHFLMDLLPRLYLMREQLHEYVLVLPQSHQKHYENILQQFDFQDIIYFPMNRYLKLEEVHIPSHISSVGNPRPVLYPQFRNFLLKKFKPKSSLNLGAKIYVSRAKAARRKVVNEEEVLEVVKKYGFRVIYFEDYSFEEQISLMSEAKQFISIHGAGFANVSFMPPKTKVLELRLRGDTQNNIYYALSDVLGLEYWYLLCDSDKDYRFEAGNPYNLLVDIAKLEDICEQWNA